jgi:hypothetical protein
LFHTGRVAFDLREPDGVNLIEQATEADEKYEAAGSMMIGTELVRRGDAAAAAHAFERAEAATKRINDALRARSRRLDASAMRPHGLERHQLATLRERLAKHPYVVAAFASRLEVAEFPTIPYIVLAVRFGWWWSEWHGEEKKAVVASISGVDLPMQVRAIDLGLRNRAFAREPASAVYRGASTPRSVTLAKWGRRAQRALIAMGVLLVLDAGMRNRDCFPGCWEDIRAVLLLGPIILGTNALILTGSPDTSKLRGVAFATSAFFAGMFAFSYLIPLVPLAFAGFMRVPLGRRACTWAVGLSVPAFVVGGFMTRI